MNNVELPMTALRSIGRVASPELIKDGVWLEVIDPNDIEGPWDYDFSRWPAETRPEYMKPDIELALRSNYGGLGFEFIDNHGNPFRGDGASTGPNEADGTWSWYFYSSHAIKTAKSLRVEVHRDD